MCGLRGPTFRRRRRHRSGPPNTPLPALPPSAPVVAIGVTPNPATSATDSLTITGQISEAPTAPTTAVALNKVGTGLLIFNPNAGNNIYKQRRHHRRQRRPAHSAKRRPGQRHQHRRHLRGQPAAGQQRFVARGYAAGCQHAIAHAQRQRFQQRGRPGELWRQQHLGRAGHAPESSAAAIGVDPGTQMTVSGVIQDTARVLVPAPSLTKVGHGHCDLSDNNGQHLQRPDFHRRRRPATSRQNGPVPWAASCPGDSNRYRQLHRHDGNFHPDLQRSDDRHAGIQCAGRRRRGSDREPAERRSTVCRPSAAWVAW